MPIEACLQVPESEVKAAISSFPIGSASGPDGPQHVSDLLNCLEVGFDLHFSLKKTIIMKLLLQGTCTSIVIPTLFSRNLTALNKNSGGIGLIAVGYCWRRLTVKCANTYATTKLVPSFSPISVSFKMGCESAVHACRRFFDTISGDYVVAKLDVRNAFKSLY